MKATIEQLRAQLQQEPENAALYHQLGIALQEEYPGFTFLESHGDSKTYNFKGIDELKKATELDPMNYGYMFTYALYREKRGDTQFALRLFQRCAELDPQADGLYDNIARLQNALNAEKENQKAHAQEKLAKKADDISALHSMGMACSDEGKVEEAVQWYTKALETGKNPETTYALLAGCYFCAKRYEEAAEAYRKQIEHFVPYEPDEDDLNDPDYEPENNAGVYISVAECYYELNDFDQAEKYYRQAFMIDPELHYIDIYLANIEYERKNFTEALALYKQAITKIDLKHWPTLDEQVALCYIDLNDFENAKTWLEKCIKKNPGYGSAYYNLAVVFDRMGDEDGTEMLLQMATQANQKDVNALFQLAKIYKRKGYYRDALELLEKALFANPFQTTIMELKAEIYGSMGDSERAEMEAGMAQFIKDLRDGKEIKFDDEEGEEGYDDEEDDDDF